MFHYYYHVYAGNKHIDLVKATSKDDACKQVIMKWGSASCYISTIKDYKAVKA